MAFQDENEELIAKLMQEDDNVMIAEKLQNEYYNPGEERSGADVITNTMGLQEDYVEPARPIVEDTLIPQSY